MFRGQKFSKNPAKDFFCGDLNVRRRLFVCRVVANGSLDLTARATMLKVFLFDYATIDVAKKFAMQRQMNRARGARIIRRSKGTEHCDYVVTRVRIYRFMRAAGVKTIVGALLLLARCLPSEQIVSQACDAQPDRINTSCDRRPRRTLRAEAAAYAMLARLSTRLT
jgi:hypothetical protein